MIYRATISALATLVAFHMALTLLDFAGIPWHPWLLAGLLGLLVVLVRRFLPRPAGQTRPVWDFGWGDGLALFALLAFTAIALTGWIATPDLIYHWGVKGHRFFLARGVDYEYLSRPWGFVLHPDYPNLLPELFAATALLRGRFAEPAMMLWSAVFLGMLLVSVREGLRTAGVSRCARQAGVALVALASGAFGIGHLMAGAADWMMALTLAAALPPLLRPPDRAGDAQIAVAAAFAAASKIEGVPLAAFLILTQWVRKPGLRPALWLGLPTAAVALPWLGRAIHHDLFLATNSGAFAISRAGEIAAALPEALATQAWHGFSLCGLLLPPLLLLDRRTRPVAMAAGLQLLFYGYVYFTAPVDTGFYVISSLARLLLHLVPALLAAAVVALEPASPVLSPLGGREPDRGVAGEALGAGGADPEDVGLPGLQA
jgi:hypothetical protein